MFFSKLKSYLAEDIGKVNFSKFVKLVKIRRDKFKSEEEKINKDISNGDTSKSKVAIYLLWRNKYKIIAITLAFMVVMCIYSAYSSVNNLTTTMSLNYEEGSKGLNPNSTRFNMYELKSTEVMERAIEYLGLTGELTPDELANNLTVENANSKTITTDEGSYFISTSFKISYTKNKQAGKISTQDIMTMICKAYNDVFHENYADKKTALLYNSGDIASMEYVEIGDDLNLQAEQMNEYLKQRISENGTFKSEETGQTFQTVERMVENLQTYDISKYNSYVLETGLAKDKTQFIQTLYYKNSVLDMQYQKSMADYSVRQDGISKYDEAMIGTVMIPAINDKNEYYMSRTNIGIDYLAKDAETHLSSAKDTLKEIEVNNDIIDKMNERTPSLEDYTRAEEMLKNIDKEFEKVSQTALETDREYIKYKTRDYLTFKVSQKSLSQKLGLKNVVVFGFIVFMLLCVLFYFFSKRKLEGGEVHA